VKLILETFRLQPIMDSIDPIAHYKRGSFMTLRQKIPHRPIHRTRQTNRFAIPRHKSKRPIDPPHAFGITAQQPGPRFPGGHIVNPVQRRINQIDDVLNVLVHSPNQNTSEEIRKPNINPPSLIGKLNTGAASGKSKDIRNYWN
jgi:hypothetical protein